MSDNTPHALYRFYDASGVLLYVGITIDPGVRFKKHYSDKPWWTDIADIKIEQFPSRAAVLEAERNAIWHEHPLHNVVHHEAAVALRKAQYDKVDPHGRVLISSNPAWRALATQHQQLLAAEKWLTIIGARYMTRHWDTSYICGQAFWYGFANAREFFGSPYLSPKLLVGAMAGWDAGEPITHVGMDECSNDVRRLTKGFMRTVVADGWKAPDSLRTEDAYRVVYERMYALTPYCRGQCPCTPDSELGEE